MIHAEIIKPRSACTVVVFLCVCVCVWHFDSKTHSLHAYHTYVQSPYLASNATMCVSIVVQVDKHTRVTREQVPFTIEGINHFTFLSFIQFQLLLNC